MDKKSEEYLRQYIKLTDTIKQKIEVHAAGYHIKAEICAWYSDWEDFCSYWCDICGYSRTEARKLYHGGIGEFMKLPEGNGIVRFAISRIENGTRNPSLNMVKKLAQGLGMQLKLEFIPTAVKK